MIRRLTDNNVGKKIKLNIIDEEVMFSYSQLDFIV